MRSIDSPEEMEELGVALAGRLVAGDTLILSGPLGAGKTALTKGIGKALGISTITSPTFVIAKEYKGKTPLIHIDAYRLIDSSQRQFEFEDLDLDTRRESAITVIEWGSALNFKSDEQYLEVKIAFGEGEDERLVEFAGHGQRWAGFSL